MLEEKNRCWEEKITSFVNVPFTKNWFIKIKNQFAFHRAFHGFGQAEFALGGLVLGSSHFSLIPQLPQKQCSIKKVSKIIISLC